MLVLSRKQFEKIRIGDDIFLHVLKTGCHTVKLGIHAPRSMAIRRVEVEVPSQLPQAVCSETASSIGEGLAKSGSLHG